jgi:hypothetical protein
LRNVSFMRSATIEPEANVSAATMQQRCGQAERVR